MSTAVTESSFEQEVLKSDKPIIVDFWAEWCGPCHALAPILDEVAADTRGRLKIAKLDVDSNPVTAATLGVQSLPTLILFKDGKPAERLVGFRPKQQLMEKLAPHLI